MRWLASTLIFLLHASLTYGGYSCVVGSGKSKISPIRHCNGTLCKLEVVYANFQMTEIEKQTASCISGGDIGCWKDTVKKKVTCHCAAAECNLVKHQSVEMKLTLMETKSSVLTYSLFSLFFIYFILS